MMLSGALFSVFFAMDIFLAVSICPLAR